MTYRGIVIAAGLFALCGMGCSTPLLQTRDSVEPLEPSSSVAIEAEVVASSITFPVEEYTARITQKRFGQYVNDRSTGYHGGDDVEFTDDVSRAREIPVVAIADGEVVRVSRVGGYGGLIVTRHAVNGRIVTALYGHVDLSSAAIHPGDLVTRGQFLANLGDHESTETDGERKHLHFGLYEGSDGRVNGYEVTEAGLTKWLNPSLFLVDGG